MILTAVTSVTQIPARLPRRTPWSFELRLACGHAVMRSLRDGPIPKRVICKECAG